MAKDRYADLNPGAVTAALRSFARRYRSALAADTTREPAEIAKLTTPSGRSIREILADTVGELDRLAHAIGQVLISDRPSVTGAPVGAPPSAGTPSTGALIDQLDATGRKLADRIDKAPSGDLLRVGVGADGRDVSAFDLARQAVRVAAENLLDVERTMRAAGADLDNPGSDDD